MLFLTLVANPKKILYTVANPARGLLNREKRTKTKSLAPPSHAARDASTFMGPPMSSRVRSYIHGMIKRF